MRPVPILMYHRLGEVRKDSIVPGHYVRGDLFVRHLRLLATLGMRTISLGDLKRGFDGMAELPKRPVVVTFDDGYESFHRIGLPALRERHMAATVFLVSDLVGGSNEWDLAKGDVVEPLMSREQVLEAQAAGCEFGAHTRRHVDLAHVPPELAEEEIRLSKREIEAWIGRPVDFFCYPYGRQNDAVRAMVREAGYRGATSTDPHGNTASTDPFDWGRINVRHNATVFRMLRRLLKARR